MWLALAACTGAAPEAAPDTLPDVLLVSLDTTRADALDSYGGGLRRSLGPSAPAGPVTPTLDALAAAGARFELALAHAPTTLSSHAAVFTGQDGHGHGVVRNGYPLDASALTLAEVFRDRGYDTRGVVGASVLDARHGIAQGFRHWDDRVELDRGPRHESLAREVTDRALRQLSAAEEDKPLLLFVHYFDAHAPYAAPEPYTRRWGNPAYDGPFDGSKGATRDAIERARTTGLPEADLAEARARYLGEVAYVDAELGRLLAGIDRTRPRVVVVFGDHGETLGDDPLNAFGHGGDVDVWAARVPLIVAGPNVSPGQVVSRQVRLQDVATTLLGAPLGDGRSLFDEAPRPSFIEASQPEDRASTTGWPNLPFERAVYLDGLQLQRFPLTGRPQSVYAVAGGEQSPLAAHPREAELAALLDAWDAGAPSVAVPATDPEVTEALEALGYAAP